MINYFKKLKRKRSIRNRVNELTALVDLPGSILFVKTKNKDIQYKRATIVRSLLLMGYTHQEIAEYFRMSISWVYSASKIGGIV